MDENDELLWHDDKWWREDRALPAPQKTEAELAAEEDLKRIYRSRIQRGECVACGELPEFHSLRVCRRCRDEKQVHWCSYGEHLVPAQSRGGYCRECYRMWKGERVRGNRPPMTKAEAGRIGLEKFLQQTAARYEEVRFLLDDRGWTRPEIARRYGITPRAADTLIRRMRKWESDQKAKAAVAAKIAADLAAKEEERKAKQRAKANARRAARRANPQQQVLYGLL